ncbi:MAG: hypothetical protein JW733_01050 [Coriobacteriia bacterium]|nr:hypothetical protein [Coriobacteriia bacterium]MBN2847524.1 hypothetical protein [Coriobacteriia bacterium]
MKRALRLGLACAALVAVCAVPAAAQAPTPVFRTLVVVLAPYLTWQDVSPESTPGLWRMIEQGAVAGAAVRAGSLDPTPDEVRGAAVLSAGSPVPAPADDGSGGSALGLLGGAIRAVGGYTAAIGSPTRTLDEVTPPGRRPARIVAADTEGIVDYDETGARVLKAAPGTEAGLVTDLDVVEVAYREALDVIRQDAGAPGLIVLDPGDASRARDAGSTGSAWESARQAGVTTTDAVTRIALRSLPDDAVLVIISTSQLAVDGPPGFGPAIVYGLGPGVLHSPATRRDGVIALPDISATVVSLLGLEVPDTMTGSVLEVAGTVPDAALRLETMVERDASARALEAVREPVWFGLIAAAVALLAAGLGAALFAPGAAAGVLGRALAFALVALCALPAGSLLARLAGQPTDADGAYRALLVATAVVALAALVKALRSGPASALAWLAGGTALAIAADQILGGPAASGGVFSYSLLFGARFYGLGNEAAALLVGGLLTGVARRVDLFGRTRASGYLWLGVPAVVVAVLPALGANIGVAAWGGAAILGAYLRAAGTRLTLRRLAVAVAGAVALVALAAALDTMGGAPSHLGRVLSGGGLWDLIARKLALSWGILNATPIVVLLPVAVGAIAYLLARPKGFVGSVLSTSAGLSAALTGSVAAAFVAVLTEDSGVAVSALVMLFPAAALVVAALERRRGHNEFE